MGPTETIVLEFEGSIWKWEGPAPFFFVTVPDEESGVLKNASKFVTYGWGMIPVFVTIGGTEWKTALFPQKGKSSYLLPIKSDVRKKERLSEGDNVRIKMEVRISY